MHPPVTKAAGCSPAPGTHFVQKKSGFWFCLCRGSAAGLRESLEVALPPLPSSLPPAHGGSPHLGGTAGSCPSWWQAASAAPDPILPLTQLS